MWVKTLKSIWWWYIPLKYTHTKQLCQYITLKECNKRAVYMRLFKKTNKMQVIFIMMRVQWFMLQMACHPTAWLTSTEILGDTRGSSSLYGRGRGLHSLSATRRNQPPFNAFPAFLTNNCQRKQSARQTRFAGRSLLIPHFIKLLSTSEGNLVVIPLGRMLRL